MAATPISLGEQISEELTCSICLELFKRPKMLPCQHTFCQDCLQDHVGKKRYLKCPNCRQQVKLPPQGVAGLPDNHLVTSLCERLQNQATLSGETREQPHSGNRCSFHPSEEVKLYCKQCNMPVCDECLDEMHSDHGTISLKKALEERRAPVQALIVEGRNISETYCSFLRSLREKEKALDENKKQTDNSIIQAYNEMVEKLTENRDYLLANVDKNQEKNKEALQKERDRVLADVNELSGACYRAEQEMEQGGVEYLDQETILTYVVGKYRGKVPTPVQTQPAVFQPTVTSMQVLGHVMVPGSVTPSAPPRSDNDAARGTGHPQRQEVLPLPTAQIPATPTTSRDGAGRGTVHLHGNQRQEVQPLPTAPVPEAPTTSSDDAGRDQIHPDGNQEEEDQSLLESPICDNLDTGVTHRGHQQTETITFGGKGEETGMFIHPTSVAVSDEGEIFVADHYNKRIQVFTRQGTFVRQFLLFGYGGQKMYPHDMAMDREGNLWVVGRHPTESVDLAVKYDKQGKALSNFSLPETDLDAEVRNGVAVDTRTKHILITQTKEEGVKGEVLVFEPDGTRVKTVGQDDLKQPRYVTVDGEGNIFVSDTGDSHSLKDTGTVYAYNKDGEFLAQFGSEGNSPRGICTDKAGNIIVADKADKRVDMFDKTGKFLKHIVTGMSGRPQAVAMAPQGQLVVTDVEHHKVIIFPESVLNSNDDQSKTVISL